VLIVVVHGRSAAAKVVDEKHHVATLIRPDVVVGTCS
jgi:hypothetical protein